MVYDFMVQYASVQPGLGEGSCIRFYFMVTLGGFNFMLCF